MLELEDALARILASLPPPQCEHVPVSQACGRILGCDSAAPASLPPFDNSSMDGYAVRSGDVAGASTEKPARLRMIGRVAAGENFSGEISSGECVRLFTGSPLPRGADAVVMQEDTRVSSENPAEILILDSAKPWENVRFRGEDVKEGTAIARIGEKISVGQLALFASLGLTEIPVAKRPRIALLATGSELKEPGETLAPGQIFESNRTALTPLISNAGGLATQFPIVEDDPKITRDALKSAFAENDIVITCGGVSVGELDFVKSAFEELGGTLNFWKVAIKPGKPFVFGRLGSKFLFGLPGNPVSAFVTFLVLVRPALLRWQAAVELSLPVHRGRLAEGISNPGDRRHFMRVRIASDGSIHSAGTQASHILSALAMANALLDVPPKTSLPAGAIASVLRWE